jgi:hypothetical protein
MTKWRFVLVALVLGAPTLVAQNAAPVDITLDIAARTEVIDGALKALRDGYVFPAIAEKMGLLRAGVDNIRFERLDREPARSG